MREGYTNPCVTRNNDYLRDSVLIEDTTSGGKNFLSGLINTPSDVCANYMDIVYFEYLLLSYYIYFVDIFLHLDL